jgi:hypothetical protein
MNLAVCSEHEGDRALPCQNPQSAELFGMLVDLRGVPTGKLRPSVGTVTEPFSQDRARCDILDPSVDRGVCFPDTTRPQPVHQYPSAISRGRALARSFECDIVRYNSFVHLRRYFVLRIVLARVVCMPL